jgi:guanylate kinase
MPSETIDFDLLHPQPLLVVISGPSGIGKDAVLKVMKDRELSFHFVVTATSREKRPGEVDGVDYFFVSRQEFEDMIARDDLIEYANVYNQYKGVPKLQVRQALASGKDVIMRLDVQGAAKIRSLCPEAVLLFLIPSNAEEWYQRLQERNTETPETYQLRVQAARKELERVQEFDYLVLNAQDRLDIAVDTIISIIHAEHHRTNPRKITL